MKETTHERRVKWDMRFLRLAREVASWSKDPSTKVGAIIVRPDMTVASLGYNGFPRGFPDDPALYGNRDTKYRYVVHAEANAIATHREQSLKGCTLYTWPLPTCADCCKLAIQAGITRFVSLAPTIEQYARWSDSFNASDDMLMKTKLDATYYDKIRDDV